MSIVAELKERAEKAQARLAAEAVKTQVRTKLELGSRKRNATRIAKRRMESNWLPSIRGAADEGKTSTRLILGYSSEEGLDLIHQAGAKQLRKQGLKVIARTDYRYCRVAGRTMESHMLDVEW